MLFLAPRAAGPEDKRKEKAGKPAFIAGEPIKSREY
jgi:hypothetical protein